MRAAGAVEMGIMVNDAAKQFASAATLPDSFEKSWATGGTSYVFVDAEGLDAKRAFIASKGIGAISVGT